MACAGLLRCWLPHVEPPTVAADAAGPTSCPLNLENCGVTVIFDTAPECAVSLYQSSTEILPFLGLADRMVGTSIWFDPVLAQLAADNERVPRLADNDVSLEVVLDAEPDIVTSASAHTFTYAVVAERSRFDELGVATYQSPSVCTEALAGELIAGLQSRLSQGRAVATVREALLPSGSRGSMPRTWTGAVRLRGFWPEQAGVVNVFSDLSDHWPEVSWEAVADRDPDVLVLGDLHRRRVDGDSLDSKIAFLESNPVTAQMSAAQNRHYITLSGSEMDLDFVRSRH